MARFTCGTRSSRDYSNEDENRPRLPMELDLDVLRSQVEASPYQTTRELAVTLGKPVHSYSWIEVNRQGAKPHALKQHDTDRRADMTLSLFALKYRNGLGVFVSMYWKSILYSI
uniref:XRE family transcriptional regulator n=1 Tax=Haemonchus placei TaxID=6290 RepID=A0A0N4W5N3_HAEPC